MTPIAKFFNSCIEFITGIAQFTMDTFAGMDIVQMSTFSICVLVIGAMCLRGNPVRGA